MKNKTLILLMSSVIAHAQILRMSDVPYIDNTIASRIMDPYASSNGATLNQRGVMVSVNQNSSISTNRTLLYDDIQGDPYYKKDFVNAKFEGVVEPAPGRYNTYLDEVEFKKAKNDEKVYILPKNDTFSKMTFLDSKDTLVRLDTGDDLSGYFFEIVTGEYGLYKKIKTTFINGEKADNAYSNNTPPSFKNLNPIFYIKTPDGFIKNPKNSKEFMDGLPGKKEQLEGFFKSNKIKFNKQDDLIKLVSFLNGKL